MIASLVSGCAFEGEMSDAQARWEAIIDGTDHASDPGVMFIVADNALCTGALIAPRVVLTAKHCVYGIDPDTIILGAGSDVRSATSYANVVEVRTTATEDIDGQDIALLLLDEAGPIDSYTWVLDAPPKKGDPIQVIGFGQQKIGTSGTGASGRKQLGSTTILRLYTKEFIIGGPTTCFGDSGAPAFLEDGRIFGVVSRGVAQCDGMSVLTRTDYYADLIAQAIADTDGALALQANSSKNAAAKQSMETLDSSPAENDVDAPSDLPDTTQASDGCSIGPREPAVASLWFMFAFGLIWLYGRTFPQKRPCRTRTRSRHNGA